MDEQLSNLIDRFKTTLTPEALEEVLDLLRNAPEPLSSADLEIAHKYAKYLDISLDVAKGLVLKARQEEWDYWNKKPEFIRPEGTAFDTWSLSNRLMMYHDVGIWRNWIVDPPVE